MSSRSRPRCRHKALASPIPQRGVLSARQSGASAARAHIHQRHKIYIQRDPSDIQQAAGSQQQQKQKFQQPKQEHRRPNGISDNIHRTRAIWGPRDFGRSGRFLCLQKCVLSCRAPELRIENDTKTAVPPHRRIHLKPRYIACRLSLSVRPVRPHEILMSFAFIVSIGSGWLPVGFYFAFMCLRCYVFVGRSALYSR